MKNIRTILFLLVVIFYCSIPSIAGGKKVNGGKFLQNIVDGVLQIPKASQAPIIDGAMDPIWKCVSAYAMTKPEGGQLTDPPEKYDDHYAQFRAMWDANNLYIFLSVVDDSLFGGADANVSSPWMNDCMELFIDGKNEKASSYDANDKQWRWVYGETPENKKAGDGPGKWAWKVTSAGYQFELAISKTDLANYFKLESDTEIGFEISNGDLEKASSPQRVLHWWTNVATTWNNPSLFGTAVLSDQEVSDVYEIAYAAQKPTIDGDMKAADGWNEANEMTLTRLEGGADETLQKGIYTSWKDHQSSAWLMWDENYLYTFLKVVDDSLFGGAEANVSSPWMNDCMEMFIDGKNEKASSYDANDKQWRWVWGETVASNPAGDGPGEWIWKNTAEGYNLELKIAKADLATYFPLVAETEIGFELSNGDLEKASSPQRVQHWWTNVATTWNNPSLFGTAMLAKKKSTDIENPDQTIVTDYRLEQNYPNPFNPTTQISYSIPKADRVELTVYNTLGNEIATLVNEFKNAGTYKVNFNAANLASGVYFYRLNAGTMSVVKKMMFLK
jgi:hypothetical protein